MMWRGWAITFAVTATVVACGDSYEEAVAPGADAGPDASPADGGTTEQDGSDASTGDAADAADAADAEIDAGYNPCDAGFAPAVSGLCEVANPFRNPSFQQTGGWNMTNGAQILPSTPGPDDLGVARIREAPSYVGGIDQTITLAPGLADIPLAIQVVDEITASDGTFVDFPPYSVFSDGRPLIDWTFGIRPGGVGRGTASVCVGEAVFFGPHDISFRSIASYYDRVDLDFVTLATDPQCPPPRAGVRNGDFETNAAWNFPDDIELQSGSGVGGSRGLHFKKPVSQGVATAHQLVSVPSASMTSPALTFHVLGAGIFHVMVDNHIIARRQTMGADETMTICMPEWSRGTIVDLALVSGGDQTSLEGAEMNQTFVIDDVSFVNVPSCSQPAVIANGDFESSDATVPGWYLNAGFGNTFGRVTGDAHGGNGFLRLASTPDSCGASGGNSPIARTTGRIPEYDSTKNGPRLSFWYRFTPGTSATADVGNIVSLAPAANWTQITRCLDKDAPGTREELLFDMTTTASPCSSSSLDIDDVVIDIDATCKD